MSDAQSSLVLAGAVVAVLLHLVGSAAISSNNEARFKEICREVGGMPAHDGRQLQCLKKEPHHD